MAYLPVQLRNAGIDLGQLATYDVVCFPGDILSFKPGQKLTETHSQGQLLALLKGKNLRCGTMFDLGLGSGAQKADDGSLRLGVVWIVDKVAIPIVVGVISTLVASRIDDQTSPGKTPQPQVSIALYVQEGDQSRELIYEGDGESLVRVIEAMNHPAP